MRNTQPVPSFKDYDGGDVFIYNGATYCRDGNPLGAGRTGRVWRFKTIGLTPPHSVAVKMEIPEKVVISERKLVAGRFQHKKRELYRFVEGESFALEAGWNRDIYGLGEFAGPASSYGPSSKPHYVLMPFFEGPIMARKKFDSMRQTIVWFLRVAFFLQEKMHTKKFIRVGRRGVEELIGLIHGDIKTDNIILHENECKVIDFGLANHIGEPTGGYEKVPNYTRVSRHIAPELFERMRPAHPSQDAYSLGNLLREMICLTVTVPDDDRIKLTPIIAALCLRAPAERPSVLWLIATLDALYCSHVTRPRVAAAAVVAVEKPTVSLDDEPEVKGVLPKRPIILSDDDEPEVAKQNELACIVEELVISDRPKDDRTHDLPQHPVFAGIRPPVALLRPADTNRVLGLRSNALSQQPRVPSSVSQATTSELMHFFATLNSRVAEGKYTHKENSGLDPFK